MIDVHVSAENLGIVPGVKVLTQWAGKQFLGEWICLKSLNSNKQHSCYMVWLATKTSRLFCGLEHISVLGTVSKKTCFSLSGCSAASVRSRNTTLSSAEKIKARMERHLFDWRSNCWHLVTKNNSCRSYNFLRCMALKGPALSLIVIIIFICNV